MLRAQFCFQGSNANDGLQATHASDDYENRVCMNAHHVIFDATHVIVSHVRYKQSELEVSHARLLSCLVHNLPNSACLSKALTAPGPLRP